MKFRLLVLLGAVCLAQVQTVSAYIYTFNNHTDEPLWVAVQLAADPTWQVRFIPPKEFGILASVAFNWTPAGHPTPSIDVWKAGFCLQTILFTRPLKEKRKAVSADGEDLGYIDAIKKDASGNVLWGPPANVVVKFIPSEAATRIIGAASDFVDSLQAIAKSAAQAASSAQGVK